LGDFQQAVERDIFRKSSSRNVWQPVSDLPANDVGHAALRIKISDVSGREHPADGFLHYPAPAFT